MKLPVIVSPEARQEWKDAADWYESRETGRGRLFSKMVQERLDYVAQWPCLHAPVYQDIRHVNLRGYPYAIYYSVESDHIHVISVFHHRRDPKEWQERV